MLTNRLALLEYDVGRPVVIHERLLLDHVRGDEYVICTPDRDIYTELLISPENPDLRSFRLRPAPNQLLPGVAAAQVYGDGLPGWTPAQLASIRDEARRLAEAERGRAGGVEEMLEREERCQ